MPSHCLCRHQPQVMDSRPACGRSAHCDAWPSHSAVAVRDGDNLRIRQAFDPGGVRLPRSAFARMRFRCRNGCAHPRGKCVVRRVDALGGAVLNNTKKEYRATAHAIRSVGSIGSESGSRHWRERRARGTCGGASSAPALQARLGAIPYRLDSSCLGDAMRIRLHALSGPASAMRPAATARGGELPA